MRYYCWFNSMVLYGAAAIYMADVSVTEVASTAAGNATAGMDVQILQ